MRRYLLSPVEVEDLYGKIDALQKEADDKEDLLATTQAELRAAEEALRILRLEYLELKRSK